MTDARDSLGEALKARAAAFEAAARRDIIDALPPDRTAAVLDLACGSGATGAVALREGKCGTWIGIEANGAAAGEARFAISDVLAGKLESLDFPWPAKSFDAVVCGEALDALADPDAVLTRLTPLLRPGARLYIAISPASTHDWQRILERHRLRLDRPRARTLGARLARLFARRKRPTGDITAQKPWR